VLGTSDVDVWGNAGPADASANVVRRTTRNRSVIVAAAYTALLKIDWSIAAELLTPIRVVYSSSYAH